MDTPLRASDADREAAAGRLRLGMGEGRLTVEELERRVEAVYRAGRGRSSSGSSPTCRTE